MDLKGRAPLWDLILIIKQEKKQYTYLLNLPMSLTKRHFYLA